MTKPLPPRRVALVTHESLDQREALMLASLQRMGRNPDISRTAYRAGREAVALNFKAIDEQRARLLSGDK
jgi:hypothetical protein